MKISAGERDKLIGGRIRALRRVHGVRQEDLANRMGLSQQQLQKYETGLNKISAAQVEFIAEVLNIPVEEFFGAGNMDEELMAALLPPPDKTAQRLLKAYNGIGSASLRALLLHSAKVFAEENRG